MTPSPAHLSHGEGKVVQLRVLAGHGAQRPQRVTHVPHAVDIVRACRSHGTNVMMGWGGGGGGQEGHTASEVTGDSGRAD